MPRELLKIDEKCEHFWNHVPCSYMKDITVITEFESSHLQI